MRVTDDELTHEAGTIGGSKEPDEVITQIDENHARLLSAIVHQHWLRLVSAAVAVVAFLAGLGVSVVDPTMALPIFAIGILAAGVTALCRWRLWRAEQVEQQGLAKVGAATYGIFQIQRVDGFISNEQGRRRLLSAAEVHRTAAERWVEIAGDVSVEWAMERHEEITATARLKHDMQMIGTLSHDPTASVDEGAAELARAIVSRLAAVRTLGRSQEGFPLVLDEPFDGVSAATKPVLLELLSRTAGSPQLVLLTGDEDVASWARLEALGGELSILEPSPMLPSTGRAALRRAAAASPRLR
jgi:hypothetical protein